MSARHAPGQFEAIGNLVRSSMAPAEDRPPGVLLARCFDSYGELNEFSDEAKANAVLFAASHDLLALARIVAAESDGQHADPEEVLRALGAQARAAITKATGSTS